MTYFVRTICCLLLTLTGLIAPLQLLAFSNDPYVRQDAYELIDVYDAWQYTTGSRDTVVAVIDNGFDHYHPDIIENVWNNVDEIPGNGIDDDTNGYIDDIVGWNFVPEDLDTDGILSDIELRGNNNPRPSIDETDTLVSGHGTAVAGLIGATGHNELLGAGINWRVSLMNLKIVGNTGNGTIQYVPEAIRYAVDNGADVISMSVVGFADAPEIIQDAIQYAYDRDVVVVAAAGNNLLDLNTTPLYPICSDALGAQKTIIGVSAVSSGRAFARFSNYGSTCIDITAPGIGVSSTMRYNKVTSSLTEQYRGELQGTSFAAPLVSGTAALIRSMYPDLSASDVIAAILTSTSKTPPQDEILYTNLFGAGLLQVSASLKKASELAGSTLQYPYASDYDVTVPFTNGVTVSYSTTTNAAIYYIQNIPVRYVSDVTHAASLAIHPGTQEVYVLEAATPYGQTISVYDQSAKGLRRLVYGPGHSFDGIFFANNILHGFTLGTDGTQVAQLSDTGEVILHTTIDLPNITLVSYSDSLNQFIGVQYDRMLFAWSPDRGVLSQTYIPLSLGSAIHMFVQKGQEIISFHDTIATIWDNTFRSKQLFRYTLE